LQRRVVVTGLGLVCAVGNTAPEVWNNILAGKSGMAPITRFDTSGFSVTFAAEVKNFDPLNFVDKKEARKMARFIHLALAASHEAMDMSGLKITEANATRVGVHIGSVSAGSTLSSASIAPCWQAVRARYLRFLSRRHH